MQEYIIQINIATFGIMIYVLFLISFCLITYQVFVPKNTNLGKKVLKILDSILIHYKINYTNSSSSSSNMTISSKNILSDPYPYMYINCFDPGRFNPENIVIVLYSDNGQCHNIQGDLSFYDLKKIYYKMKKKLNVLKKIEEEKVNQLLEITKKAKMQEINVWFDKFEKARIASEE